MAIVATLLALNVAGLRDRLVSAVGAGLRARPAEGTHGGVPLPKIESIAVLPLENLSRDPEQEYFADGMTDALITDLGKISALRVISRTSAMHYKGTKKRLPEIAKELNVDAIVEGTVQRSGDRVRITANLLHAPTDRHLWAESYERDLQDILTLQSEIAQAIAREVRVQLSKGGMCLAKVRPVNPAAHDAYLRGCFYLEIWRDVGWQKVIEYLEKAASIDPTYAPTYARLAIAYNTFGHPGIIPPGEAFPKAREAARRALELDETLAEAHAALSYTRAQFEWDWAGAEREAKRALELDPNNVQAIGMYATFLIIVGQPDEAIAVAKRLPELDPFGPLSLVWVYANSPHV